MHKIELLLIGFVISFSANVEAAKKKEVKENKTVSIDCDGGLSFSGVSKSAEQITFIEKGESMTAKLNAMDECKGNIGKFLCYHAGTETMINLPLDIAAKKSGAKVVIFINDDADDVVGNGKSHNCQVK